MDLLRSKIDTASDNSRRINLDSKTDLHADESGCLGNHPAGRRARIGQSMQLFGAGSAAWAWEDPNRPSDRDGSRSTTRALSTTEPAGGI